MRQKALDILDRLTRERADKEDRLVDLLRDPEHETASDWLTQVPTCFNDALDIRQTPQSSLSKDEASAYLDAGTRVQVQGR